MSKQPYTLVDTVRAVNMRDLGCIVCINVEHVYTLPAIHHIDGQTKEGCHQLTLPLCGKHHQIKDNNKPQRWISRHGDGRAAFEKAYGTEYELLEQVNNLL